ncbi:MAG: substrate-binding domain-containing protein [Planctomycetota bacterium]
MNFSSALAPLPDQHREIAVVLPPGTPGAETLMRGIGEYARQQPQWRLALGIDDPWTSLAQLEGWPGHGIIAHPILPEEASALSQLFVPHVNLAGWTDDPGVVVAVDHHEVGRLAALHLLGCGYRRLGFIGLRSGWHVERRAAGFADAARSSDAPCDLHLIDPKTAPTGWDTSRLATANWLKSLDFPIGVMAANDLRARIVVEACRQLHLRVPEDVGVMGADSYELVVENSDPPLTTIRCSEDRVGYEAAALLDRLIGGASPPYEPVLVSPEGVVPRHSTDIALVGDHRVAAAVRFIRKHVAQPFDIGTLLKHVGVSRRRLELGFRESLGVTPYEYLSRVRAEQAKSSIEQSVGPVDLEVVARGCGFTGAKQMRAAFSRCFGETPKQYLRRSRLSRVGARGRGAGG